MFSCFDPGIGRQKRLTEDTFDFSFLSESMSSENLSLLTMLTAHIITLFPDAFTSYFSSSIMRIAREKELFEAQFYNLSDFSNRPQGRVDDAPYGGGAGQLIQVEPIFKAIESIEFKIQNSKFKISQNCHCEELSDEGGL